MPNLTSEKELLILEALKAKIEMVPGAVNVVADEPLLDSKQDVLDTICVQSTDDETEVKYIKIDYLGWRDSETDGCEDNPVVFLKYKIHAFCGYKELRGDGSTSAGDIKALGINLHNTFRETKNNARRLLPGCEHLPLTRLGDIVLDADELTGAYGYSDDYSIEVEIS